MWTSVKKKKCDFGVAIYNFHGIVKHGLCFSVGDVIDILEECDGWYRGLCSRTKETGIFPSSYVVLREFELESDGLDAVPILVEDSVSSEVCCALREWNSIVKKHYQQNQRTSLQIISSTSFELIGLRKILVSGTLTQSQISDLRSKITKKIDLGNKRLGLDLVPRVNNEPVNVDKTDPVELFRLHLDSSANAERNSKPTKTLAGLQTHHLIVKFNGIVCQIGEDLEFHFALYDSQTNEFFTERFLLKLNRQGEVDSLDRCNPVIIFTHLGEKDFHREVYLVAHMFKLGSLRDSSPNAKAPTLCYKRPFGCGVYNISSILMKHRNDEETKEVECNLKVTIYSESDFHQLHENLIKKQTSMSSSSSASSSSTSSSSQSSSKSDVGFSLSVKMLQTEFEMKKPSELYLFKDAIITNKIGFPDVIMPAIDHNDLYLTLERGEFERGSKTAQKNIEVRVCVLTKDGHHVERCISRGTGEPDLTEYNSFIFYHNNTPRWNDTIRLRIPVDQFCNSHIRLEFRHCSNKDKTEKKMIGMCFLRLITDEFMTLPDGSYELCFYKFDDVRRLHNHKEYTNLPDVSTEPNHFVNDAASNSAFRRSDREAVYVSTRLCSTKYTQNGTLLGILKWKLEPHKVVDYLNKMILQNGEEIIKFLQYIMDALFDIMIPGNCSQVKPLSVFKAVVHVFHLLKDERFERYLPVMDDYIDNVFSAPLVYKVLTKCVVEILNGIVIMRISTNRQTQTQRKLMDDLNQAFENDLATGVPSLQHQMFKSLQVLKNITRCIVQSRILFMNCPQEDSDSYEITEIAKDIFDAITQVLSTENSIVLKLQIVLLHQIPGMLEELSKLIPLVNLCQAYCKFISTVKKTSPMELVVGKLNSMRVLAGMPRLMTAYECKTILIPMYVAELSHFLCVERDPKLVAEILMEILASLHSDQNLTKLRQLATAGRKQPTMNITLRPHLAVILDGLLEEILNFLDTEKSSHLIACLTSMLILMDETHFRQLLLRYEEKQQLEVFFEKMLLTFRKLLLQNHYPDDWLVMMMVTNRALLKTLMLVSTKMKETFLSQKLFNRSLWCSYFYFAVTFVTQHCLQLERHTPVKQSKIKKRYGDLRLKMVHEFLDKWQCLKPLQSQFLPEYIGPILEMALVPEAEIRKALMPVFFEMMLREWENSKTISKFENEFIDRLDILVNNNKGDEEFRELFNSMLLGKLQVDAGWSKQWKEFIVSATSLLDILLDYRSITALNDNMESKMKCIFNLLSYYSTTVQRQTKYLHYLYKLYDLHRACGNHTEAALTLKLHSDLLEWSDKMLPPFGSRYAAQFEWQRLESIYQMIITEFDNGKMWEYGLPFLEKLADIYKEKILYGKLSDQLRTAAEFYQKILGQQIRSSDPVKRFEPTYFLMRFFGLGFSIFFRNKEFIYRGNECEKLIAFQNRILFEISGAIALDSMNLPADSIRQGQGKYIQICVVTPLPTIDPRFMTHTIPDCIRSFYRANDVSEFYVDRPFHSGKKDENNDFKTLFCERLIMKTCKPFPGVMRWFEVISQKKVTLSPIEVAIDAISKTNDELHTLVMQFNENPGQNLNPLTMRLKGVIDAPVQGGFPKYQEAFFNDAFRKQNPQYWNHLLKLVKLFDNQVMILEAAMIQHKHLAPTQQQPLHRFLEEQFAKLKQKINDSSRFIGYVPQESNTLSDVIVRNSVVSSGNLEGLGLCNKGQSQDDKETKNVLQKIIPKWPKRDSTGRASGSTLSTCSTTWYRGQETSNTEDELLDKDYQPPATEQKLSGSLLTNEVISDRSQPRHNSDSNADVYAPELPSHKSSAPSIPESRTHFSLPKISPARISEYPKGNISLKPFHEEPPAVEKRDSKTLPVSPPPLKPRISKPPRVTSSSDASNVIPSVNIATRASTLNCKTNEVEPGDSCQKPLSFSVASEKIPGASTASFSPLNPLPATRLRSVSSDCKLPRRSAELPNSSTENKGSHPSTSSLFNSEATSSEASSLKESANESAAESSSAIQAKSISVKERMQMFNRH